MAILKRISRYGGSLLGHSSPLHVELVGVGRPAMLVHGEFSDGRLAWSRQRETLPGRQLALIDRRGYGRSPRAAAYTINQDATDLFTAADALGWDQFDLVGHSYGGVVALVAAGMAPERLRSLLVIEPPCLGLLPNDPEVIRLRNATTAVRDQSATLTPEEIAEGFFAALNGPESVETLRMSRGWSALVSSADRFPRTEPPMDFTESQLAGIPLTLPVAVMTGTASHAALQHLAHHIATKIPQATLTVVPGAGHAVQFNAQAFAETFERLAPIAGSSRSGDM